VFYERAGVYPLNSIRQWFTRCLVMFALAHPIEGQNRCDRERDGILGPVRAIRHETVRDFNVAQILRFTRRMPLRTVTYDASGNKVRVINFDPASRRNKQTEVFKYDDAGRKIEWSVRQGSTKMTTIYRYDAESHKIEAWEQVVLGKQTISRTYISVFDSAGHQTEASYRENSGREIKRFYSYEFDDAGRIVLVNTYDENGRLCHKSTCEYDSLGNPRNKTDYGPEGVVYERREFTYTADGKREKIFQSAKASGFKGVQVRCFDNRNNIVDVTTYGPDERLLGRNSHRYDYDDVGNWTRKISQSWDVTTGQPTSKSIEYQLIRYCEMKA